MRCATFGRFRRTSSGAGDYAAGIRSSEGRAATAPSASRYLKLTAEARRSKLPCRQPRLRNSPCGGAGITLKACCALPGGNEVEIEVIKTTGDRLPEVTCLPWSGDAKACFTQRKSGEALIVAISIWQCIRCQGLYSRSCRIAVCPGCDAGARRSQRRFCLSEPCKSRRAAQRREGGNQQPAPPRAVEGASP